MRTQRLLSAALSMALPLLVLLSEVSSAHAAFHVMKVVQVFSGTAGSPNAQYVVLQMYAGGQNFVGGHSVIVYDAANVEVGRATFGASVPVGTNQSTILIATSEAATLFGITPDLTMTPSIRARGGRVCFDAIDCVAWGDHVGGAGVGVPLAGPSGLPRGRAAIRRLDVFGSPTILEGADDTGDSANDWILGAPAPRNNAGMTGTLPAGTCGNGTIEGAEGCDDGNVIGGDGCSETCSVEVCGDLVVSTDETCDDGNLVSGDGCDANCRVTGCGSGVVTTGEACDDGNLVSGDGCDLNCTVTACGNGVRTGTEVCDDANLTSGDGCDANCTLTGCGNGIVTAGEGCEPPSVGSCDAACQLGCTDDSECVDTDACTSNERCASASCAVDVTPVDDAEPCTVDACDSAAGVTHEALPDGMLCEIDASPELRTLCLSGACGASQCGDGWLDSDASPAEACDDGNTIDTDACTASCTVARCGDGIASDTEECDDGNLDDTDACTECMSARCGDGVVHDRFEACDDGADNGTPGRCALDCRGPTGSDTGVGADAGRADAGVDAGGLDASVAGDVADPMPSSGCGCRAADAGGGGWWLALLAMLALRARRRGLGRAPTFASSPRPTETGARDLRRSLRRGGRPR